MKFKNPWESESEMLIAFAARAKELGWLVHPETAGFDLLLVATADVVAAGISPGDQVGVEGKKTCNVKVLSQAMPSRHADTGPNFHAIVVPRTIDGFEDVARALHIRVIVASQRRNRVWMKSDFRYDLIAFPTLYRQYYNNPCWHPDVEIWTPPGVAGPKTMSQWKIKAVKLCLIAKQNGFLTSLDFRDHGVAMTFWHRNGWLQASEERVGRRTVYKLVDAAMPPHLKYPEITEVLAKDVALYDQGEATALKHAVRTRTRRKRRR